MHSSTSSRFPRLHSVAALRSRGFALIIALGLMAFVLILMLSLSSMITVESQSASMVINRQQAKDNALLALQVALGELQNSAGPDQRVTGTAALLDSTPATSDIDDVNQPYWTGVWNTDTTSGRPELLTWLVSGNANLTPVSGSFVRPTDTLPDTAVSMTADDSVSVPLEEVDNGAYAYWISDEGVKAKVTLADPSNVSNPLTSAQMVDITEMTGLSWLDSVILDDRERAPNLESLKILAPSQAYRDTVDSRQHDLTAHSYGLLTNPVEGGLKQDLTLAIFDGSNMPTGQIFEPISGFASADDPGGPNWQQLRSWAQIRLSATAVNPNGSLAPRPATDDQTGISPVITQVQLYVVPRYVEDTVAGTRTVWLDLYPAITLWNPYDRALGDGETYTVDLGQTYYDGGAGSLHFYDGTLTGWGITVNGTSYDETTVQAFPGASGSLAMDTFQFELANVTLAAGESMTFSPLTAGSSLMTATASLDPGFRPTASFRVETDVEFPFTPGDPAPSFTLQPNTEVFASVRLLQGNDILQEVFWLGGLGSVNPVSATMTLPGATGAPSLDGAIGLKATRNFTANGDSSIKWLAHHNPRAAAQGALPLQLFGQSQTNVEQSHMINPSFYSVGYDSATDTNDADFQEGQPATGSNAGNGYSVSPNDITETVLFETPPARADLQSIGQLMHAPLFRSYADQSLADVTDTQADDDVETTLRHGRFDNFIPAYAIGNSEADPRIPLDALYVDWDDAYSWNKVEIGGRHYDYSYLLNQALWDHYFFSTLSGGTDRSPENQRMSSRGALTNTLGSDEVAIEFMVDGAFNVNSTSEEAWKAVLSAFFDVNVNSSATGGSAYLRTMDNPGSLFDPSSDGSDSDSAYHGYRALTSDQITNLAHQIVQQLKWRARDRGLDATQDEAAPFTSLADFVNRDPDRDAPTGLDDDAFRLRGVLSAALLAADNISVADANDLGIDPNDSKINAALQDNADKTQNLGGSGFEQDAQEGWRSEAIPGWLTQADLLARLGPVLTVRSDTFKIRVYGECRDPFTDEIKSKAWGEAIVQRQPEFVEETSDSADTPLDSLNSTVNEQFGRRFIVVDFRWLNDPES